MSSLMGVPFTTKASLPAKLNAAVGVRSSNACRQPASPYSVAFSPPRRMSPDARAPSVENVVSRSGNLLEDEKHRNFCGLY